MKIRLPMILLGMVLVLGMARPVHATEVGQTQTTVGFYNDVVTKADVIQPTIDPKIPNGKTAYQMTPKQTNGANNVITGWLTGQSKQRLPQTDELNLIYGPILGIMGLLSLILLGLIYREGRRSDRHVRL